MKTMRHDFEAELDKLMSKPKAAIETELLAQDPALKGRLKMH